MPAPPTRSRELEVAMAFAPTRTEREVGEVAVGLAVRALSATSAALAVLSDDGVLRAVAASGLGEGELRALQRVELTSGQLLAEAVRTREPAASWLARAGPRGGEGVDGEGPGAVLALPAVGAGQPLGGLLLAFAQGGALEGDDLGYAEALAAQVGQALDRVRHAEAEGQARRRLEILAEADEDRKRRHEDAVRAEREREELLVREQVARREAETASRAKDEFLAMLGHELRNPLSPILTALELMRLRGGDAFGRERTIVERQVKHLLRLVDDLLDVSRITRGKIALRRRPVELSEVVAAAIETASPALEARRQRLRAEVPRRGLLVDGDPDRLAQVVANLLTNSAKYTGPGGDVEVRAWRERGRLAVRVRDTGIGIVPELLPRVFDLFVQGPRALDRAQGGLGLGLTIVRSLVELHGGRVEAASEGPGCGSAFTVWLPATARAAAGSDPARRADRGRRAGRRVLVVDDNHDAADALVEALAARGMTPAVAYDGPAALAAAVRLRPDVALLDIGLPVMDGYELARRLRELLGGKVRLVALTGYGQDRDRALARKAGFDEHLVKPVELEEIMRVLAGAAAPGAAPPAAPG